ncbi:MAG: hypothetical protein HC890_04400 [Chloroflexaceae bacterium]|nr:hypothetical protein [Chloroflexaceae bacterium]
MNGRIRLVLYSSWQYLNQPIFGGLAPSIWSIKRFWYFYRLQLLKKCWSKPTPFESHIGEDY